MTTTLSKELATKEDLAIGYGPVTQSRNGVSMPLSMIDFNTIEEGITPYNSDVTYPINAITKSLRGIFHVAIAESMGFNPLTDDGTHWGVTTGDIVATTYGPTQADLMDAILDANIKKVWVDLAGFEYEFNSNFTMPIGGRIRNGRIKLNPGVDFRGDAGCGILDIKINANGADFGLQEVETAGVTNGMKRGLIRNVTITNAVIGDVYLNGYHFLLEIDRLECFSSNATGWGLQISNIDGTLNPDVKLNNCYIDGPDKGYNFQSGSFHMSSCSADSCTVPINGVNAFMLFDSCGFEQFGSSCHLSSCMLYMNLCTMTARVGAFIDDGGQRAFITVGGGTINASVEIKGGIYQNNSDDACALIRGSSINLPQSIKISTDVEIRPIVSALTPFIYQSTGSPAASVARISFLGDRRNVASFGGIDTDPGGQTVFPMEITPSNDTYVVHSNCTARYITWREIGDDTAGASTGVDFVVYNSDGTEKSRYVGAISIPGIIAFEPKRFGDTILDIALLAGEYVKFDVAIPGERPDTGFAISLVIDQ